MLCSPPSRDFSEISARSFFFSPKFRRDYFFRRAPCEIFLFAGISATFLWLSTIAGFCMRLARAFLRSFSPKQLILREPSVYLQWTLPSGGLGAALSPRLTATEKVLKVTVCTHQCTLRKLYKRRFDVQLGLRRSS